MKKINRVLFDMAIDLDMQKQTQRKHQKLSKYQFIDVLDENMKRHQKNEKGKLSIKCMQLSINTSI